MMKNVKWFLRKGGICFFVLLMLVILGGTFQEKNREKQNSSEEVRKLSVEMEKEGKEEEDKEEVFEKGYDLPVEAGEKKEAEADCKKVMALISELYERARKGTASNAVIAHEMMDQMRDKVKESKRPVTSTEAYANMENYQYMENFLMACMDGKSSSVVIYKIHSDGSIGRSKYIFDGTDMYVLGTSTMWKEGNVPGIVHTSYNRIKKWEYTDKGWFCYELCVPEPPEVTEIVDGSCMIRIVPMKDEYREISEKCVLPIGYQGNNLLCSDWDAEHLENIDYNGMYEYLYRMEYQKNLDAESCQNGIAKEEFENIIMEYLPLTSDQIEKYAVFDKENQVYKWERLGCFNYAPAFFGTAIPEVINIKEKEGGEVVLTVDAVCEMILCSDAVITHELTIRILENGSFQYIGNKILEDGLERIPDYQYRLRKEELE